MTNMPMDGLGVTSKLKNGGKRQRSEWTNAKDQASWEPEGPVGGIEMNSIETKYIEQDELVKSG